MIYKVSSWSGWRFLIIDILQITIDNLQTGISSALYIIYYIADCRFTISVIISFCYDF